MGGQGKKILVVMTNSDVYYINESEANQLGLYLAEQKPVFKTRDTKSGAVITIQLQNVSSVVEEADRV